MPVSVLDALDVDVDRHTLGSSLAQQDSPWATEAGD
jgi:hypothetical protein